MRIGISACFFHADPQRPIFKGKTLLYLEESLGHWITSEGVLAYPIPSVAPWAKLKLKDFVSDLDGLVLQGGSDVSPISYGEKPLRPEWSGDYVRDRYEIELVQEFMAQNKPVLGVCRGAQLINVALGGTLVQDIPTQLPTAKNHRNWEIYDQNFHMIEFEGDSLLRRIFPSMKGAKVNTIHHQALKDLGTGLVVEARSKEDGIIEAVRLDGKDAPWVYAVQWHPEFHNPVDKTLLNCKPLLQEFLKAARKANP